MRAYNRDELINRMREIFEEYGDISSVKYEKLTISNKPGRPVLRKYIGGWRTVKQKCGYDTHDMGGKQNSKELLSKEFERNTCFIESKSYRIRTLEDALAYAEVDLDIWEVDRCVINKWEMGAKNAINELIIKPLWQVKVWLKRIVPDSTEEALKQILDDIKKHAPIYTYNRRKPISGSKHLYEIAIFDFHFSMFCWEEEVGENYDTDIALQLYSDAIADLLDKVQHISIDRILLPTGNDFLHTDNMFNTTTAGTHQDIDTRWQRAFRKSREMLVEAIDRLATVAPVTIPIIPGNHDWEKMFYLGEVLSAWYANNKRVMVDNTPDPRKYYRYGKNLIGFTHGKYEKEASLPLIMAKERPEDWSQTDFQEWHIGHWHRKGENRYMRARHSTE